VDRKDNETYLTTHWYLYKTTNICTLESFAARLVLTRLLMDPAGQVPNTDNPATKPSGQQPGYVGSSAPQLKPHLHTT
jgi:hypothetical protein